MLRPNHLDNFGTNLTSVTTAGDTTSPVNSVPSIAAPFWVAFDATNINGNYERKLITSKTATNILHSALSFSHTTDEEVRIVNPAEEFDAIYQVPQGYLINGKIVPSVSSNNLTVALKTQDGNDPSETDPVFVRIGNSTQAVITALSVTKNAGTNWFNSGSSELAAKEIDYFVYLGYNATDGVTIGFSRIPSATQYGDFSATTTNEKYCAISTITNAASTDYYENVGRFAATLGVSATYLWTVPTFTAANLVQRPIFETRWLSWTSVLGDTGGSAPTFTERFISRYKIASDLLKFNICWNNTSGGTAGTGASSLTATLPFDISTNVFNAVATRTSIGNGASYESTGTQASVVIQGLQTDSTKMVFYKPAAGTSIIGTELDQASRFLSGLGEYEI